MAQIIVHLAALRLIKIPLDLQIFPFEAIVWQFVHACRRPSGVYSFTVIFLWQTPATLICQRHYTHESSAQQHHCHLFTIACSNPGIRVLNKGPWRESGDVVKDTKGSDKERQHVSGLKVVLISAVSYWVQAARLQEALLFWSILLASIHISNEFSSCLVLKPQNVETFYKNCYKRSSNRVLDGNFSSNVIIYPSTQWFRA